MRGKDNSDGKKAIKLLQYQARAALAGSGQLPAYKHDGNTGLPARALGRWHCPRHSRSQTGRHMAMGGTQ